MAACCGQVILAALVAIAVKMFEQHAEARAPDSPLPDGSR
jgi:hypothetical protein